MSLPIIVGITIPTNYEATNVENFPRQRDLFQEIQRKVSLVVLKIKAFFGSNDAALALKFRDVSQLRDTIESSFLSHSLLARMRTLFLEIVMDASSDNSWSITPEELRLYLECFEWDLNDNKNTPMTIQRALKATPEQARRLTAILHSQNYGSTERTIDLLSSAWEKVYSELEEQINNPIKALCGISNETRKSISRLDSMLHEIFNRLILER